MIRLSVAQLCPDCDVIYEEVACPHCLTQNGLWLSMVLKRANMASGCWTWSGGHNTKGYGYVKGTAQRRGFMAHRLLYRIFIGPIPAGLQMDHLCRNRGCVNPWHLEPVTSAVNNQRSAKAKLTAEQVSEIRAAAETSSDLLAEQYGVTSRHVEKIKRGDRWKETQS